MAVKSALKGFKEGGSSHQPYDRDKVPGGYDPAWWDLALKYEQGQERALVEEEADGIRGPFKVSPRPIIYMEIKSRAEDMGLDSLDIIEEMIERFWDYEFIRCDSDYKLAEFCGRTMFRYLYDWVMNERELERLKTGPKIIQQDQTRRTDIPKREKDGHRQDTDQCSNEGEYTEPPSLSELKQRLADIIEGIRTTGA